LSPFRAVSAWFVAKGEGRLPGETANQLKDAGLTNLKTDGLLDPLRREPEFQAIYAKLNFPP
jgi:hypothetical protein